MIIANADYVQCNFRNVFLFMGRFLNLFYFELPKLQKIHMREIFQCFVVREYHFQINIF